MAEQSIRYAQAILQRENPSLIVDGKWGHYTDGVYRSANQSIQANVNAVLAVDGLTADSLIKRREQEKSFVSLSDLDRVVKAQAEAAGVSPTVLRKMLLIENPRLDPKAVSRNGSSHGLFQVQKKTWEGVLRNNALRSPTWEQRYEIEANTKIAALLTRENAESLRRLAYPGEIDGRAIYLAHQQGPTGAVEIARRMNGQTVAKSVLTGARIRDNLPKGVPTDAANFSAYWWKKAGEIMG